MGDSLIQKPLWHYVIAVLVVWGMILFATWIWNRPRLRDFAHLRRVHAWDARDVHRGARVSVDKIGSCKTPNGLAVASSGATRSGPGALYYVKCAEVWWGM
jgi:hypothetical protein